MRHVLLFCLFLKFFATPVKAQIIPDIPFCSKPVIVDGNLEEWTLPIRFSNPSLKKENNNIICGLCWDAGFLYIAFRVRDTQLCVNESGNGNSRLYFNDAVEVYIDSKNDSNKHMDLNDYQFLLSISEHATIFKGDKQQIKEGSLVPKDHEGINMIIQNKVSIQGTINNTTDQDEGYCIESAIPWSAIGIRPVEGYAFRIDLCHDDVDTISDIKTWPVNFHPPTLQFVNLQGQNDFGYPDQWHRVQLTGKPGWEYRWRHFLQLLSPATRISIVLVILTFVILLWLQHHKIKYYRKFPNKEQLLSASRHNTSSDLMKHDQISAETTRLKNYIDAHMMEDIPVEHLAKELNISVRQLQRLLKAHLNVSPRQYVTIQRLEKASELLREGTLNISEIAFACGFTDPSYFGVVFKKYFEMTPVDYKKRHA